MRLTSKAVREIGRRYDDAGLEQALYAQPRPSASPILEEGQRHRIIAMVCSDPPEGHARWTVRLVVAEAVKRRLVPRVGRETIRCYSSTTTSSLGGKKMGSVPELDEQYITKMEDVWRRTNSPTTPKNQWCVWMRSPLHCMLMSALGLRPSRGGRQGRIANTNGVARPMFSAR